MVWQARHGLAGHGEARRGKAGGACQGKAGHGVARCGLAGQAR